MVIRTRKEGEMRIVATGWYEATHDSEGFRFMCRDDAALYDNLSDAIRMELVEAAIENMDNREKEELVRGVVKGDFSAFRELILHGIRHFSHSWDWLWETLEDHEYYWYDEGTDVGYSWIEEEEE